MLRDKNATREFEASLSYEVKRLKIAARKLHIGIMDICMIKHGLAALIANEKVTLKIAIKKGDKEQIERINSYIDEVKSVLRKLNP